MTTDEIEAMFDQDFHEKELQLERRRLQQTDHHYAANQNDDDNDSSQ